MLNNYKYRNIIIKKKRLKKYSLKNSDMLQFFDKTHVLKKTLAKVNIQLRGSLRITPLCHIQGKYKTVCNITGTNRHVLKNITQTTYVTPLMRHLKYLEMNNNTSLHYIKNIHKLSLYDIFFSKNAIFEYSLNTETSELHQTIHPSKTRQSKTPLLKVYNWYERELLEFSNTCILGMSDSRNLLLPYKRSFSKPTVKQRNVLNYYYSKGSIETVYKSSIDL